MSCAIARKEALRKNKKTKQYVPHIGCDIKAGKIINAEFLAKCPAGCGESKHRVYGSDIYASFSSVCSAAIHSGTIDNAGGKILVRKIAGQSGYKGSYSNGIRSLSLPRWRESFIIADGKGKKGISYPSILEFTSDLTAIKTGESQDKEHQPSARSPPLHPTTTSPESTTTMTLRPTTMTPASTNAPSQTTTTTIKPGPLVHRPRDIGANNDHSVYTSVAAAASRHIQSAHGRGQSQAFRSTSFFTRNRNAPRANTAISRQDPATTLRKPAGAPVNSAFGRREWQSPTQRTEVQTGLRKHPETKNIPIDLNVKTVQEASETKPINHQDEYNSKTLAAAPQGDLNCKIDLAFLIDGSWSIGKRRFRIQKLFLNEMAQALHVGPVGPLMGIVQYGDDPSTEFGLTTYSNSKDVRAAIEKIPQKGGLSNVGQALSYVNKNFFSDANGNRGGAPNVALVLVDGWPTDKVEEASRLARESGINIFFVTIEGADEHEKPHVVEPNFVDKAVCRTNGFFSMNVPSWFSLHKIVQPLVKRVCDTDRLMCSKTCLNAADIGFVIDGSSSVGTGNFRTVLQFIANITKEFEISDTDTRVGAVQYTYEQRLEFGFEKYSTKEDVMNAIKRINYWSGGTSTGAAISYASEHLFSKSKPNKRKIMIVITDGRSYDDVRVPAMTAHRNGVIVYAIGIAWAALDELESIATDPDKEHSFFVEEFDSLYKFVGKIIQNICTEFNSQPRN
ncbi:vitrin isoform X2 [Ambystoma mexicanum]